MPKARRFWPALWKINFAQRARDPDIDGECLGKTIRKQQNAIGDFNSDTRKFDQCGASFFHRQIVKRG
jgi:hypothetical protein